MFVPDHNTFFKIYFVDYQPLGGPGFRVGLGLDRCDIVHL